MRMEVVKKIISILLILYSCLVSGCGREILKEKDINTSSEQVTTANGEHEVAMFEQSNIAEEEDEIVKPEQSAITEEKDKIDETEQSIVADKTDVFVGNPYFYDKEEIILQAKAKYFAGYSNGGWVEKTVYINVDMLQTYEEGSVYKLTIDMDEKDVYFEESWLNLYFYVTKDRIYSVTSTAHLYPEGIVFNLNDDIDILTEIYDTDEKLVEWSTIVCQEQEMIEDQGSDYRSITKTGNQVTYYAYSLKESGDIWWILYYTWQEGNGLVSCGFRQGVGEGYDLTLYEIEELIVAG